MSHNAHFRVGFWMCIVRFDGIAFGIMIIGPYAPFTNSS